MAAAKQQAARRLLYASFYRGPVLTNEYEDASKAGSEDAGPSSPAAGPSSGKAVEGGEKEGKKSKKRKTGEEGEERADGTPRKVQKGQINALAKMLSALRR